MSEQEGAILSINRRTYPNENFRGVEPLLIVVLVAGAIGDYAAYAGYGEPEWVAENGNKISFEEACGHFPDGQLKKELYRD